MAAKVVWYRNSWWVRTHAAGKKHDRKVGPTKAHKREAGEIARKINAALALGQYEPKGRTEKPLPCDIALRQWHRTYSPTFKLSFETESARIIETHLVQRWCQLSCVKYPAKGLSFRKPEFRNGAFLQDTSIFIATKARIR